MKRSNLVKITTGAKVAIGGLFAFVVIALFAMTPLRDGLAQAQGTACVTGGAVPSGNAGLAQDCETMLGFMDTLRGTAELNWSASLSMSLWTGVRLGGSPQRVTIIKLQRRNLDGRIPADIGKIEKLVDLWLYVNNLTGALPAELGSLTALETLMLSDNQLSGQIPLALNNLTLNRLWLRRNNFTGCIPYNLTQVPDSDLQYVNLPTCDPPVTEPSEYDDHCQLEDIQTAYNDTYVLDTTSGPWLFEHNGRGWHSSYETTWTSEEFANRVYCLSVVYDNASSAYFDLHHDSVRQQVTPGSFDVLDERRVWEIEVESGEFIPQIGDEALALKMESGRKRAFTDTSGELVDSRAFLTTVGMFRRGNVGILVMEDVSLSEVDPDEVDVDSLEPPTVTRIVEVAQRIASRMGNDVSSSGHGNLATDGVHAKGATLPQQILDFVEPVQDQTGRGSVVLDK